MQLWLFQQLVTDSRNFVSGPLHCNIRVRRYLNDEIPHLQIGCVGENDFACFPFPYPRSYSDLPACDSFPWGHIIVYVPPLLKTDQYCHDYHRQDDATKGVERVQLPPESESCNPGDGHSINLVSLLFFFHISLVFVREVLLDIQPFGNE